MNRKEKAKITFPLARDEDGFPPDDYETLWAEDLGDGMYRLDNIPFYLQGVSPDDLISARESESVLWFSGTIQKSGKSVVQVVFFDLGKASVVLEQLVKMGAKYEGSHLASLYSVEIPEKCDYRAVILLLEGHAAAGLLDYQEASVRHT